MKKKTKKVPILLLCLMLIATSIVTGKASVSASDMNKESNMIVSFEKIDNTLVVPIGTEKEKLELPDTLKAKLDGKEKSIDVPVTWDDANTYDETKAGDYTFTAVVENYTYEKEMPKIVVTVEKVEETIPVPEEPVVVEKTVPKDSLLKNSLPVQRTLGGIPFVGMEITGIYKIAVIDESTGATRGSNSLEMAMYRIGDNTGAWTIVFLKDYDMNNSTDIDKINRYGTNASQITFMSTYNNGTKDIKSTLTWGPTVNTITKIECQTNTVWRDIKTAGGAQLFVGGNGRTLTIESGVEHTANNNDIYGGSIVNNSGGGATIIIKSGNWDDVRGLDYGNANTYEGDIKYFVEGTAKIKYFIPAEGKARVNGDVEVTIDDKEQGKVDIYSFVVNKFHYSAKSTILTLKSTNFKVANLDITMLKDLYIYGNTIIDGSINGSSNKKLVDISSLNIMANAKLGLKSIDVDSSSGRIYMQSNSTLEFLGGQSAQKQSINYVHIAGVGTKLAFLPESNTSLDMVYYYGTDKLTVTLLNQNKATVGRRFVSFKDKKNANKEMFLFSRSGGVIDQPFKEGIEQYGGNIIYTDCVPDDGYTYNSGETLTLGKHNTANDMKTFFEQKEETLNYKEADYGRITSKNLYAKKAGFTPVNITPDGYYYNYFNSLTDGGFSETADIRMPFSLKVDSRFIYLFDGARSSELGVGSATKNTYRGYRYLADGTLSLMFKIEDKGKFYLNLGIKKGSTHLRIDWRYENVTTSKQDILLTYSGDTYYAGKDQSYVIFGGPNTNASTIYHYQNDPAMFMYVDTITTETPVIAGNYSMIEYSKYNAILFDKRDGKKQTSGDLVDTGMGIQWKYAVPAKSSEGDGGGVTISNPGDLQLGNASKVYENPTDGEPTKSIALSVLNLNSVSATLALNQWTVTNPYAGITVTPTNSYISPLDMAEAVFNVQIDKSVAPGVYPVEVSYARLGKNYPATLRIEVRRDIHSIDVSVKNKDGTSNATALSNITKRTIAPVVGDKLYKYYDSKLAWTIAGHTILDIQVNGTSLTASDLTNAKRDNQLLFNELSENKNIEIIVKQYGVEINNAVSYRTINGSKKLIDNSKYTTYAFNTGKAYTVFELKSSHPTDQTVNIALSSLLDGTLITPTSVYSSTSQSANSGTPVTNTMTIPANGTLYLICEFTDLTKVTYDIGTLETELVVTEGIKRYTKTATAKIAGTPTLRNDGPMARYYHNNEIDKMTTDKADLKEEERFYGLKTRTSNATVEVDYTWKGKNAYNQGVIGGTANNLYLQGGYGVKTVPGIYPVKTSVRDMQFAEILVSGDVNSYINMLDATRFSKNMKISTDRTQYLDAKDASVQATVAKAMFTGGVIDKQKFVDTLSIKGAGIDATGNEVAFVASDYTINLGGKASDIAAGKQDVYAITITTNGTGNQMVSQTVSLLITPDGVESSDHTVVVSGRNGVVTQTQAKTLTRNITEFKRVLGVSALQVDIIAGTIVLIEPSLTVQGGNDRVDRGELGTYKVMISASSSSSSASRASIEKDLLVVPDDYVIGGDNTEYVFASNKIEDTHVIKEQMKDKDDTGIKAELKKVLSAESKLASGTDQTNDLQVTVIGKTLEDIKKGVEGNYTITFTTTKGTAKTVTLTIIDEAKTWGVSIPKVIGFDKDNMERSNDITLIGSNKYVIDDFTDDFDVTVKLQSKNGYILKKDGEASEDKTNAGYYNLAIAGMTLDKDSTGKAEKTLTSTLSKTFPILTMKTKMYNIPIPEGLYTDTVHFSFTGNGIAVAQDKYKP